MLEIIQAAGWPIYLLIVASVLATAIILERFYTLRVEQVAPTGLLEKILKAIAKKALTEKEIEDLRQSSISGKIFASAITNANFSREILKETIEETGRAVAHELNRYLTTLGTIATITPLLGLLGTVIGMVELFGAFNAVGSSHDVVQFAKGISIALYNTAAGIIVAVPAMIFYRHFRNKVDGLIVEMEQQAIKIVEILQGARK